MLNEHDGAQMRMGIISIGLEISQAFASTNTTETET
jgi:hypothetical protein